MSGRQRIVPNIWCQGDAEEAGAFYASAFPGLTATVEARYPEEGLLDFQRPLAGQPLTVALAIPSPGDAGDRAVAEATSRIVLINAGDEFRPNPSISFMLNFDPARFGEGSAGERAARESLDATWAALSTGGRALMPLGEYPFSAHYGWVEDRFGVSWQLMLTDPTGAPRPFIVPALMFDGAAQGRAAEAADAYVELFSQLPGGAEVGHRAPYGAPTGDASAEALAFGEFRIGDQWFMASDNGSGNDFGFSCGVSLEADCDGQAEIDLLWDALSAVPEAEQCGWLADRFGVSWQIVPANLDELMARPGAYGRMMEMHKIVIDEF